MMCICVLGIMSMYVCNCIYIFVCVYICIYNVDITVNLAAVGVNSTQNNKFLFLFFKYCAGHSKERCYAVHHVQHWITSKTGKETLLYSTIHNNPKRHFLNVSLRWQHIWMLMCVVILRSLNYFFPSEKSSLMNRKDFFHTGCNQTPTA